MAVISRPKGAEVVVMKERYRAGRPESHRRSRRTGRGPAISAQLPRFCPRGAPLMSDSVPSAAAAEVWDWDSAGPGIWMLCANGRKRQARPLPRDR